MITFGFQLQSIFLLSNLYVTTKLKNKVHAFRSSGIVLYRIFETLKEKCHHIPGTSYLLKLHQHRE